MLITKRSVATFSMFPIKLLFNLCCRNVYARCTEVLAGHPSFLKGRDVLPISHHPCGVTDIKLKIHIEILVHTQIAKISKHQQMEKTFNSMNLCIQKLSPLGGLCSGGGPAWHVMSVDCVQCEYQL